MASSCRSEETRTEKRQESRAEVRHELELEERGGPEEVPGEVV